jgi:hypothetical protein
MATRDPRFPPVRPASDLVPWDGGPQRLTRNPGAPGTLRAPLGPSPVGGGFAGAMVPGPGGFNGQPAPGQAPIWTAEAHRYARITNALIGVDTTSALVLTQPDTYRNFLAIRNPNAVAVLYISFGSAASTNSVFRIAPNIMLLFDSVVPQDDIYVLSDTAASQIAIAYSTVAIPEIY